MQNEYLYSLEFLNLKILHLPFVKDEEYRWYFYRKNKRIGWDEENSILDLIERLNWLWEEDVFDVSPAFFIYEPINFLWDLSYNIGYPAIIEFLFALNQELLRHKNGQYY